MKQNAVRRDPNTKADGKTDHEALRAERDEEAARDLRLRRRDDASTVGDETMNRGRAEAQLAGGNGEQRSRERARVQSEADPAGKQPPFHKAAQQAFPSTHVGAEQAIADDERTTIPR